MGKGQKQKKVMSLAEFHAEVPGEVDPLTNLPTAPRGGDAGDMGPGSGGVWRSSRGDGDRRFGGDRAPEDTASQRDSDWRGGDRREGGGFGDRREGGYRREGGFGGDRREGGGFGGGYGRREGDEEGGFRSREPREPLPPGRSDEDGNWRSGMGAQEPAPRSGGFGERREGGFGGERREGGGFGGYRRDSGEGGFGGERREGGYRREGGFGGDRREGGGFGGGYGRREGDGEGGFRSREPREPLPPGRSDEDSNWRSGMGAKDPAPRSGGFGGERREGGFSRREGGFGDRREGGFGGERREGGGFGDRRREGGEGGFGGERREGGSFGRREGGRGFGGDRLEGGPDRTEGAWRRSDDAPAKPSA